MRKFTDNDLQAAAAAFQVFIRRVGGASLRPGPAAEAVRAAAEAGVTLDELFNKANFVRSAALGFTEPSEYVGAMARRDIQTLGVAEEPDWNDETGISLLAELFHTFFTKICPKGGTWRTASARNNLEWAVQRFTLQAVLSEALIEEVKAPFAEGGKPFTCFNYLHCLLHDAGSYHIEKEPTEQTRNLLKELSEAAATVVENPSGEKASPRSAAFAAVPDGEVNDTDIYGGEAGEDGGSPGPADPDIDPYAMEEEDFLTEGTLIAQDPTDYKRECVKDAILGISIREAQALAATLDAGEPASILVLVEELAAGRFDPEKEDLQARDAHQSINNDLGLAFVECVRLQGVELDDESVQKYDPLKDNWDLRDAPTRKFQKMQKLVFHAGNGDVDPDLLDALRDLEKMYAAENAEK